MEKQCSHCSNTNGKLLRCGECKSMYYCNVKCQRQDYSKHKEILGTMKFILTTVFIASISLTILTFIFSSLIANRIFHKTETTTLSEFPLVDIDEYCGEWSSKKNKLEKSK